jgi:hypothetical protein
MQQKELFFVIPTYRLREVGDTVKAYDDHFWRNGHSVPMVVFDDSSPANQEKYYSLLESTATTTTSTTSAHARKKNSSRTSTNACLTNACRD